jgi:hypothetical protein
MSAHADDLRNFYNEHLGDSAIISAIAGGSLPTLQLTPGRYLIHFADIAGGCTKVWIRQGPYSATAPVLAAAAVPSTPFDVSAPPYALIHVMARFNTTDQIAAITNAGTASVIVTKVSRDSR